ncbi:MAG: cupredoxin domain-containing protein [Pseudonocardiaceae bacterium]
MTTQPAIGFRSRSSAILFTAILTVPGLVVGCGAAAASSGWSGGSAAAPPAPNVVPNMPSNTIVIKDFSFEPASLTVAPGTRVTVLNQDQAAHTLTADDKSFDAGTIAGGQRTEITAPSKPGRYPYLCLIHQYMTGTLVVR